MRSDGPGSPPGLPAKLHPRRDDPPCRLNVDVTRAVAVAGNLEQRSVVLEVGVTEQRREAVRADRAVARVLVAIAIRAEGTFESLRCRHPRRSRPNRVRTSDHDRVGSSGSVE